MFLGTIKNILIFCILALMGFQPTQDYETISWDSNQKLSWKDFKGTVPRNPRAAATTASGITYRFSTSGTPDEMEVDFQIDAHFYPNESWYRPDICDSVILGHEQLHFDISELYARKMREQVNRTKFSQNIKAEVKAIYRKTLEDLNDFQNRYDDETNFSRNLEQQELWNHKIKAALAN